MNAPGVKLICRTSYEEIAAERIGTPFDYPLSSRFDENDAIFVLDNVLDPLGERASSTATPTQIMAFYPRSGFLHGFMFQGCTRYAVKLDFIAGLLAKALRATGGDEFRGNQAMLGEVDRLAQPVLGALRRDGDEPAALGRRRACCPNLQPALGLSRVRAATPMPRIKDIVQEDSDFGADLSAVLGGRISPTRRSTRI